jgi:predicted small metal-binding protein
MKYSFSCPAPCNYEIKVDAKDDDEAIGKIMAEGIKHAKKDHPDMPPMTEGRMKTKIRTGMKKM